VGGQPTRKNCQLRRDLSTLDFKSLYMNGGYKIPLKASEHFAHYQHLLDTYWQPVDGMLNQSIDKIFNRHFYNQPSSENDDEKDSK